MPGGNEGRALLRPAAYVPVIPEADDTARHSGKDRSEIAGDADPRRYATASQPKAGHEATVVTGKEASQQGGQPCDGRARAV
jgi:hypothetical protein